MCEVASPYLVRYGLYVYVGSVFLRIVRYGTVRYGGPRYTVSCAATCYELAFRAFLTSRFACTRRTRALDYIGQYRTVGSGRTVLYFLFKCWPNRTHVGVGPCKNARPVWEAPSVKPRTS